MYPYSYLFMEFKTAEEANYVMGAMNGFAFDKKHTFAVNRFTDIERFANLGEKYVEPEIDPYTPQVRPETPVSNEEPALTCVLLCLGTFAVVVGGWERSVPDISRSRCCHQLEQQSICRCPDSTKGTDTAFHILR